MTTGLLAALRERDKSGRGQIVDVNLQQVGFYIGGNDSCQALATGNRRRVMIGWRRAIRSGTTIRPRTSVGSCW